MVSLFGSENHFGSENQNSRWIWLVIWLLLSYIIYLSSSYMHHVHLQCFFSILCVMSLWFPPTCLARTTCIETCASHWLRSQQKCHHWTFLDKSWKTMKILPPSDFWLYHTCLGCGKNLTLAAYFEIMIHAMRPSQGTRMRRGLIPTV